MPIYEFKCMVCEEYMELFLIRTQDNINLCCKKCGSRNIERVISSVNYSMSNNSKSNKKSQSFSKETKSCSGGSCTTYNIPGPA